MKNQFYVFKGTGQRTFVRNARMDKIQVSAVDLLKVFTMPG